MSSRYDDSDYDRDSQYYGQYNQRPGGSDYGRGYSRGSESGRDFNSERYGNEGRFIGDEDRSRYSSTRSRGGRQNQSGRDDYWGRGWENERNETNRESRYGSYGRSGAERGYSEGLNQGNTQRYNYPTGFRSNERYGEPRREFDYDRNRYGRSTYDRSSYDRSSYDRDENRGEDRGWLDRASDAISSWFGDEEAQQRRQMDAQREHRGRGPKGYRRSDERIREDVNDRLSDDYYLDASDVEVSVSNTEVTLTGTVNNRNDKRRAEDLAESVSGVSNVENRLRVKQSGYGDYRSSSNTMGTSNTTTQTPSTSDITGTPGALTSSSAAAGGRTGKT